jgi:hypothetical protein
MTRTPWAKRGNAKWETRDAENCALYPPEILPYICDERVDLAPNLTWCGELNVLPTASVRCPAWKATRTASPPSCRTRRCRCKACPTMKGEGVKLMFTTGCVTLRNYIKRKVGYKAEHFHTYGALIVEVNDKGHWYVRQLRAWAGRLHL